MNTVVVIWVDPALPIINAAVLMVKSKAANLKSRNQNSRPSSKGKVSLRLTVKPVLPNQQ